MLALAPHADYAGRWMLLRISTIRGCIGRQHFHALLFAPSRAWLWRAHNTSFPGLCLNSSVARATWRGGENTVAQVRVWHINRNCSLFCLASLRAAVALDGGILE